LNDAAAKARLRRRIADQRRDLAAAGHTLAAPLRAIDAGIAAWRGLPPIVRAAVSAAGALAVTRVWRHARGRSALWRFVPVLLGLLRRPPSFRP
jgi:hypothetical protein